MIASEMYKNLDGTSIFGANPNLSIQASENNFCEQVISEIEKIDFINYKIISKILFSYATKKMYICAYMFSVCS